MNFERGKDPKESLDIGILNSDRVKDIEKSILLAYERNEWMITKMAFYQKKRPQMKFDFLKNPWGPSGQIFYYDKPSYQLKLGLKIIQNPNISPQTVINILRGLKWDLFLDFESLENSFEEPDFNSFHPEILDWSFNFWVKRGLEKVIEVYFQKIS